MNSYPKVTIVTPSYNQDAFLEATIQSVLSQSYPNLEYIIIDGGSTDSSINIITKYQEHLAYWISEKDNGQSEAINKGFQRSTGKYINWLNSDDILLPNALKTLVEYLEENKNIDCVFGNTIFIDLKGKELFKRYEIPFHPEIVTYSLNYLPQPSALLRKAVLDRLGLLDERLQFCMDYELWLRISRAGYTIGHIRSFVSGYRLHLDSKGVINSKDIKEERLELKHIYGRRYSNRLTEILIYQLKNIYYRVKRIVIRLRIYGVLEIIPGPLRLTFFKFKWKILQ